MLIKQKDFLTFEYTIKNSIPIFHHRQWVDKAYLDFKRGNLSYKRLYQSMQRTVLNGNSTFETMEELASQIERDAWYLHNYGDAKYWEKENKKVNKNGKNKNNDSLSGRQSI